MCDVQPAEQVVELIPLGFGERGQKVDLDPVVLPGLADRWSRIEEFSPYSDIEPDFMLPLLREFVGLAHRARTGKHLLLNLGSTPSPASRSRRETSPPPPRPG
ncbi:hypothetical protein GCM10027614_33610 [Micromonospora vulcania]